MIENTVFADQRYYYVIVFGPNIKWKLSDLWRAIGTTGEGQFKDEKFDWGLIEHRSLHRTTPYPSQRVFGVLTKNEVYIYNLFAIEMRQEDGRYVALGVPFFEIGLSLETEIHENKKLLDADFMRINIMKLVNTVRLEKELMPDISLTKLDVRLDGYPNLNGFSISGDNTVQSLLFEQIMGEIVPGTHKNTTSVANEGIGIVYKRCCARVIPEKDDPISVHSDLKGNFRIWVRKEAKNVKTFRHYVKEVQKIKATDFTSMYPFSRGKDGF